MVYHSENRSLKEVISAHILWCLYHPAWSHWSRCAYTLRSFSRLFLLFRWSFHGFMFVLAPLQWEPH